MQDVLPGLQKRCEKGLELLHIHLGGGGGGPCGDAGVKGGKGKALPQVVGVLLPVHLHMEGDVGNAFLLKVVRAQVCSGAAGQLIGIHKTILLMC